MLIQSTPEGKTVKTRGMLRVDQDGVRFEANDGDMLYQPVAKVTQAALRALGPIA